MRKAPVVSLGEGYNKFPRILQCSDDLDTALSQLRRTDHRAELEQQLWVSLKQVGSLALENFFEEFSLGAGHAVPGQGFRVQGLGFWV